MHVIRDHFLPPDPQAFLAAEPPTGRVIVIAPTRAACETIELAMGLRIETLLEREHGGDIRRLAESGRGFGIVAGTGTGKTLAVRVMAETMGGPASCSSRSAPLLIASFAFNFNNFTLIFLLTGAARSPGNTSIGATDLLITYTYQLAIASAAPPPTTRSRSGLDHHLHRRRVDLGVSFRADQVPGDVRLSESPRQRDTVASPTTRSRMPRQAAGGAEEAPAVQRTRGGGTSSDRRAVWSPVPGRLHRLVGVQPRQNDLGPAR